MQNGLGPRPTRDLSVAGGLSEFDVAETLRTHARTLKGRTTQIFAVDAIKAAALPFAEGIAVEAELARKSLASRESHALFHIFFAERESGKVAGLPVAGTKKQRSSESLSSARERWGARSQLHSQTPAGR